MNTHKIWSFSHARDVRTLNPRGISLPLAGLGWWMVILVTGGLLNTSLQAEARERDSLMGPYPYDFPARASVQGSLLLQEAKRRNSSGGSGSGASGRGDINAETITNTTHAGAIINNNSTSIAVGNWQQIEMLLGDGSEGLIMTENHQSNEAEANSLSEIGATLNMEEEKTDTLLTDKESSN